MDLPKEAGRTIEPENADSNIRGDLGKSGITDKNYKKKKPLPAPWAVVVMYLEPPNSGTVKVDGKHNVGLLI